MTGTSEMPSMDQSQSYQVTPSTKYKAIMGHPLLTMYKLSCKTVTSLAHDDHAPPKRPQPKQPKTVSSLVVDELVERFLHRPAKPQICLLFNLKTSLYQVPSLRALCRMQHHRAACPQVSAEVYESGVVLKPLCIIHEIEELDHFVL